MILSSLAQKLQLKQAEECQVYFGSQRHVIRSGAKYTMIFGMNDFAAIIVRRYYTLSHMSEVQQIIQTQDYKTRKIGFYTHQ